MRIRRLPHAQRAGQQDRRLQLAQLGDLGDAQQLAESVAHVDGRGNPVEEQCCPDGEEWRSRRSGPSRPATTVVCPTRTPATSVIALQRAGSQDAGGDAQLPGPEPLLGTGRRGQHGSEDGEP